MPVKKGHTNNPAGRIPGSKNKKTKEWEALKDEIIGKGAERFKKILSKMGDDDYMKYYLMTLEYFKPKQQRTEIEATHKMTTDFSTLTTDELKERAEALKQINDSSTRNNS